MQGISVHLYRIVPINKKSASVEAMLKQISGVALEKRIRLIGQTEVRLEELEQHDGYYLMDFVRLRFEHGPGRAHRKKELEGFHFAPGEGFGEETAVLYDPKTQHMVIQYNHDGVRSGRIAEYLGLIDDNPDNQYDLEPRFEPAIERKLMRKHIVRSFHFRIATRRLSKADKMAGQALTSTLDLGEHFGAETIDLVFRASRGKRTSSLKINEFRHAWRWLRERIGIDEHSVDAVSVFGKDDADSKAEILNLLGHRLKETFTDLHVDADLRYPRDQRWNALLRARAGWDKLLKSD